MRRLILLLPIFALSDASLFTPPSGQPVCDGQWSSGPGGMFGYDIAMSSGVNSSYSWMAIGKPWDCSVHLYSIRNPDLSELTRPRNNTNETTSTPSGPKSGTVVADIGQIPVDQWTPIGMLGDTNNGSYPRVPYSLFGYSVALSDDGAWLAVGIPGRTYVRSFQQLQFAPYSGAVRIYRRADTPNQPISHLSAFLYMGEIPNPNSGERFWDKFGSKVHWGSIEDASVPGGRRMYLFVAASGGWDGASTKFYNATPDTPYWPQQPVTDVSRAGIYVYELTDPTQVSPSLDNIVTPGSGLFQYKQFLSQKSRVPLGSIGLQMTTFQRPSYEADRVTYQLSLLVRDFVIPPSEMDSATFSALCPSGLCSYVKSNVGDGVERTYNATGVLLEYALDPSTGLFHLKDTEPLASLSFPLPGYAGQADVNNGYRPSDWERSDWFGASVAVAYDPKYDRHVAAVGAPRDAYGVYSFSLDPYIQDNDDWQPAQFLLNDDYYRRSFFGHKLGFSADSRFLVVADTVGSGTSMGRGQVFLYYRRSESESLVPNEYNQVAKSSLSGQGNSPFVYDKLSQFSRSPDPETSFSKFQSDQFGLGLATNKYFAVVSAPLEQCVYTFAFPAVIDYSANIKRPPRGPGNYTISRPAPTATNTSPASDHTMSQDQAWLYGLIAGLVTLFVIMPVAWFLLKYWHRKKVMLNLKNTVEMDQLESSEEISGKEAGTRGVSLEDIPAEPAATMPQPEVIVSSETLDNVDTSQRNLIS